MFRGNYEHTIDQKGRLSIPSKFREVLKDTYDEKLIITRYGGCLVGYPEDEWIKLERKIAFLPQHSEKVIAFQRFVVSSAVECPVDKQGRVLIPQYLRTHAELDKDVILAGLTYKIEFWNKVRWDEGMKNTSERFGKISEDLGI
jgi:transcriptional regulator MraZ